MAKERRIAVIGSTAVGKSSLIVQFAEEHFADSYYPTIENKYNKSINYNNKEYLLEILDTAGQDEFSMISNKILIGIHGYILVYSINSKSSFEILRVIRDKILDATGQEDIPMIIIGNKSDLNLQRQVSLKDLQDLSKEFNNCAYLECSAKLNENVSNAFKLILDSVDPDNSKTDVNVEEAEKLEREKNLKNSKKNAAGGCMIV